MCPTPQCLHARELTETYNSEGAAEILEEYYSRLGGREQIIEQTEKARTTKKRGRQSGGAQTAPAKRRRNGAHPADGEAPASASANASWKPPSGSWEEDVDTIDACEDEDTGKLIVYLNWKNGHKTKHTTEVIYKRCPQKVCYRDSWSRRTQTDSYHRCFSFTRSTSASSKTSQQRTSCRPATRCSC